jgi:hypothetical protein
MRPPLREKTAVYFAGWTFVSFMALFFGLRIYVLLFARNPGHSPAVGFQAGFLEDAALAGGLALLTLLALVTGKRVYFSIVFPLKILVVVTSYANLQYINFYGENIRLFDLEYLQNMGPTWKETLRDLWVRPFELLFLIIPMAALVMAGIFLHRTRILKTASKKIAVLAASLAVVAVLAVIGGTAMKQEAEIGDFSRNNLWVGFIKDIPRLGKHLRMVRKIRATAVSGKSGITPGGRDGKGMIPGGHPFPLAADEVRYSGEYPYIKVPKRDAFRMGIPGGQEATPAAGPEKRTRPARNIVFIILESFRCREIGAFGGAQGLTPNFDALAAKGTLFTDFYGHCDMTAGAEFSALNSFYDIFKGVTVMRKHDRISLLSLPEILGFFGYSNLWINSWSADFDNSRSYFKRHGDFTIVDKASFPPTAAMAGWSYSDEDTMKMAVKTMDESKKPFFAIVLSATNHMPYEVPEKKFELGLESDVFGKYLNTFHYTDFALGRFFDMVREKDYFKNTVFFIFADTGNNRTKETKIAEFERCENEFHIPLLIYDPADEKGRAVSDIAGQVDLAPTVLDLLDVHIANAFVGRSLLRKGDSPFYLAYHGRDAPMVRYYDATSFCCYNTAKNNLWVYDRKDGRSITLPPDARRRIVSNIRTTLDLGDWAIYNNRVWDRKIDDFYKSLFGRD